MRPNNLVAYGNKWHKELVDKQSNLFQSIKVVTQVYVMQVQEVEIFRCDTFTFILDFKFRFKDLKEIYFKIKLNFTIKK